ncbi:hypothetical protein HDU98_008351 [Podochytrium sp. JEL0797]|nr:hypothetical protein HDU98_008351 [Podochytrium sp. JEL0797]
MQEDFVLTTDTLNVSLRPLGATIHQLEFMGTDVVLGYNTAEEQEACKSHPYISTIGRVANRIANAQFSLDGHSYQLAANNGPNSLHGGNKGWDTKEWTLVEKDVAFAKFESRSAAGEEGFPLPVIASVSYSIKGNDLEIEYGAIIDEDALDGTETTQETIVNMTTHSYFNLSGFVEPTVLDHVAHFPNSLGSMELNSVQIPTGRIVKPANSPAMDFTTAPKSLGRDIAKVQEFKGYDHFYLVKGFEEAAKNDVVLAASVSSQKSGIRMDVLTDALGFQIYTANYLDGSIPTKSTQPSGFYNQHAGVCLETSAPPDAINSSNDFIRSAVILKRGGKWSQKTIFRFAMA